MVSVARQEINIIALNCISRARQRLATFVLRFAFKFFKLLLLLWINCT